MSHSIRLFAILALALPSACNRESSNDAIPTKAADPEPLPSGAAAPPAEPAPAPSAPPPPAIVAKVDAIEGATLKAGLDVMLPRVRTQVDAFTKIAPKENHRFFMHPDEAKNAVVEFEVKGLKSLSIAPYIEDFSGNPPCVGNPAAGVVQLTWSLDGGEKHKVTIDRTYNAVIPVDVSKATRLKLEVDKGNDVTYCDWASVGFTNVVK
jgi:hypothetical protein